MQLDFVFDAMTTVLDLDFSEECYSDAVNAQVCLMSGTGPDDTWDCDGWDAAVNITVH